MSRFWGIWFLAGLYMVTILLIDSLPLIVGLGFFYVLMALSLLSVNGRTRK